MVVLMEESKYRQFKFIVLFPLIILYFEIVFRIFTTGNFFSSSFFPMLFFSLAYGGIGYLLSSLHKNIKVNKGIAAALIFFTCLLYIVQFLIYKQFKQFYDINTMTGGAGDAVTSFFSEIMHLIFQQGGIFVILLFLLPFILYLIFSARLIPAIRGNFATRIVSAGASAISYGIRTDHRDAFGSPEQSVRRRSFF